MMILIKLFQNGKLDLIRTVKCVKHPFMIQIQKGGKVLHWNQVKSKMEACYSELALEILSEVTFIFLQDVSFVGQLLYYWLVHRMAWRCLRKSCNKIPRRYGHGWRGNKWHIIDINFLVSACSTRLILSYDARFSNEHLALADFKIKVKQIVQSIVHFDQWNPLISKM